MTFITFHLLIFKKNIPLNNWNFDPQFRAGV